MTYPNRNWPAILDDVAKSGLSVTEYSRRSNIPYSTLVSHCRHSRRKMAEQIGFVQVAAGEETTLSDPIQPGSIRIHVADVVIELEGNISRRELATVLEALDARAGR